MTRSITGARRAVVVLAGTAAIGTLLLSGCGAGQIAETAAREPTSVGANVQSPDNQFKVRNLSVAYPGPQGYPAGADAPLHVGLFNDSGAPVTVRVSVTGAQAVRLVGAADVSPTTGGTPSVSPTGPTPEGTATTPPPAGATGTASPEPGGTGTPSPGAESPSPSPAGPVGGPAEIQLPAGGYVILDQTTGSWLQLTGLAEALTPGQSISLVFDFNGTRVEAQAPVAVPLTPAPTATPPADVMGGHEETVGGHP